MPEKRNTSDKEINFGSSKNWEQWSRYVLDELLNLNNSVKNLEENDDLIGKELEKISDKITALEKIVKGNGEPEKGLSYRLLNLEKDNNLLSSKFEKYVTEQEEKFTWYFRLLIGAGASGIGSIVFAIIHYLIFRQPS